MHKQYTCNYKLGETWSTRSTLNSTSFNIQNYYLCGLNIFYFIPQFTKWTMVIINTNLFHINIPLHKIVNQQTDL